MEQLITKAVECANRIMAKRNERIEISDACGWFNINIHHKDRIGSASLRKDATKLSVILWHIHYYATGYYPFNYYTTNRDCLNRLC